MRALFSVAPLLLVFGVGCAGCNVVIGGANYKATKAATLASVAGSPLSVRTENGSVEVKTGGTEITVEARVQATSQARADAINVSLTRASDGTVTLAPVWPAGGRTGSEGCSFIITMPDVASVNIKTTNGSISLGALAGDAVLVSSNGSVRVDGPARAVNVDTSNASVTLTNVQSAIVDTSNASVSITLADDAVGPVSADTSNGSITFSPGKAFVGGVKVSTSNGGVKAAGPTITKALPQGARSGTIYFGGVETPVSKLDTSNASITISGR